MRFKDKYKNWKLRNKKYARWLRTEKSYENRQMIALALGIVFSIFASLVIMTIIEINEYPEEPYFPIFFLSIWCSFWIWYLIKNSRLQKEFEKWKVDIDG